MTLRLRRVLTRGDAGIRVLTVVVALLTIVVLIPLAHGAAREITPHPKLKRVYISKYDELTFEFGPKVLEKCDRVAVDGSEVEVTLRNHQHKYVSDHKLKYVLDAPIWCNYLGLGPHWNERGSTWIYDQQVSQPTIGISPRNYGTSLRDWGYWVTISDQLVRKGGVHVKSTTGRQEDLGRRARLRQHLYQREGANLEERRQVVLLA